MKKLILSGNYEKAYTAYTTYHFTNDWVYR